MAWSRNRTIATAAVALMLASPGCSSSEGAIAIDQALGSLSIRAGFLILEDEYIPILDESIDIVVIESFNDTCGFKGVECNGSASPDEDAMAEFPALEPGVYEVETGSGEYDYHELDEGVDYLDKAIEVEVREGEETVLDYIIGTRNKKVESEVAIDGDGDDYDFIHKAKLCTGCDYQDADDGGDLEQYVWWSWSGILFGEEDHRPDDTGYGEMTNTIFVNLTTSNASLQFYDLNCPGSEHCCGLGELDNPNGDVDIDDYVRVSIGDQTAELTGASSYYLEFKHTFERTTYDPFIYVEPITIDYVGAFNTDACM